MTPRERLDDGCYPDPNSGCLLFFGPWSERGYGRLKVAGKKVLAHRLAWELAGREVPPGLRLLHKCDTPCCVNVDHLFLGSQRVNVFDMLIKQRARKHPRGLPFGVSNEASGHFRAQIRVGGKQRRLGTFDPAEEAGAA